MIALICGGRDYLDRDTLERTLTHLADVRGPFTQIIHGAARGADTLAGEWGIRNKVPVRPYPAHWRHKAGCEMGCAKVIGPGAGPIRNEKMLAEWKPDLVIAFPGGSGTTDMMRRAHAAGVEVLEITKER